MLQYAVNHFGLANAEDVVVSGMSAGGKAAAIWTDHIADYLEALNPSSPPKVKAILDSPLFFDV